MSEAVIWLIAGIALLAVEVFTGTFVLVMLGGGAIVAAASAGIFGTSTVINAVIFAVVSIALLAGVRPALRRRQTHLELDPGEHSPVGASGLVVQRVDRHGGQIKIDGELWSARSLEEQRVYQPGERVTVMRLSGVTAVVSSEL